jgi:hypothetical protein
MGKMYGEVSLLLAGRLEVGFIDLQQKKDFSMPDRSQREGGGGGG